MNWRRGLIRVWLAVSGGWVAIVAAFYYFVVHLPRARLAECLKTREAPGKGNPFDCFSPGGMFDDLIPQSVVEPILFAVVPPLVVLGLGLVVGWIGRGFRQD